MRKRFAQRTDFVRRRQRYQLKRKKKVGKGKSTAGAPPFVRRQRPRILSAPSVFKLQFENCQETIAYVNAIKKCVGIRQNVTVDLSKVEEIGEGAIAMLLSVMREARKRNV